MKPLFKKTEIIDTQGALSKVKYHRNGVIAEIYSIDDWGQKHGQYKTFDKIGRPILECEYENDKLIYQAKYNIESKNYRFGIISESWFENGKLQKRHYYNLMEYFDYQPNGLFKEEYVDGKLNNKIQYYSGGDIWDIRVLNGYEYDAPYPKNMEAAKRFKEEKELKSRMTMEKVKSINDKILSMFKIAQKQ